MKGVIIAAGYGTRFLPSTKTIPKEMLPIIDIPTIEFTVREFVDSGISEILIVSSRRKKAIEDYFDREMELEAVFEKKQATEKLMKLRASEKLANFHFVRQKEMKGTAHAILLAKSFVGDEPFVVAY
ncbi:MAG: sugar phosphate nucleotidyltransferase, partial [Candidatus Thorarchaeota archaeon]